MKKLKSFLNIDFLIKDNSSKNWKMILFISTLAVIMISSGHSADKKIFRISSLNTSIKSLKSDFIQIKEELLILKKESSITQKLLSRGVVPASLPPIKIILSDE
tara:strand:+ start:2182 stop:2493 length:312 start_codon:yes stop_codon:yes gene_type:complete